MKAAFACAVALRREHDLDGARDLIRSLLARAPGHPRLLTELGVILYREGDFAAAEKLFRAALARAPGDETAAANLCMLCARVGRQDEAAAYASRILAAQPRDPLTWYTLGIVYAWRREWEQSLDYSLIAVGMDDKFADAHYNCACGYAQLGNAVDAFGHLARALVNYGLLHLAAKDPDLDPLRGHADFAAIVARARERLKEEDCK